MISEKSLSYHLESNIFSFCSPYEGCLCALHVLSYEFGVFLMYSENGLLMGYLLSERGDSGGVWKTTSMEISVKGNHRVGVIAQINAKWNGTLAFTNTRLEQGQCTTDGNIFSFC